MYSCQGTHEKGSRIEDRVLDRRKLKAILIIILCDAHTTKCIHFLQTQKKSTQNYAQYFFIFSFDLRTQTDLETISEEKSADVLGIISVCFFPIWTCIVSTVVCLFSLCYRLCLKAFISIKLLSRNGTEKTMSIG